MSHADLKTPMYIAEWVQRSNPELLLTRWSQSYNFIARFGEVSGGDSLDKIGPRLYQLRWGPISGPITRPQEAKK